MARTKEQIFQFLINTKNADPILSAILTSESKASFYQSLFALYAEVTGDFELTFDDFENELNDIVDSKQVHNDSWWQRVSLAFQLGDPLAVLSNGNLGYAVIDEEKQIIKRAAVVTGDLGSIQLKVAKLGADDITPEPLSSSENSAFTSYINDIGPSGIVVEIISIDGDEIRVGLDIIADPQIINLTDGTLLTDGVTKPVEDAIFDYFATFQDDDFGGVFYSNKLLQSILEVTGVLNATFNLLEKKAQADPSFEDVLVLPGKSFSAASGYVRLAVGFDLSGNITYS